MSIQQRIFGLSLEKIQSSNDVDELAAALRLDRAVLQGKTKVQAARLAAIQRLAELKDPRAVEPLVAALNDPDWLVRNAAVQALGRAGDPRAVPALIERLQDRYWEPHLPVVQALGQIGDSRAVQPLVAALKDSDQHVQRAAIEALAQIGDPGAAQPLVAILQAKDKPARQAAVQALDRIGWKPGKDEAAAAYWAAQGNWQQCARIGAAAVNVLVEALQDRSESRHAEIARTLGQIGDDRAVKPLINASQENSGNLRWTAVEALVKIGSSAVEPLIHALKDVHWEVRWSAASALGQINNARAVDPLVAALDDQNPDVRQAAIQALAQIGGPEAIEGLVKAQRNYDVSESAEKALQKIGWKPGKDTLGASYWAYKREWKKCVEIGAPAVKVLLQNLYDSDYQVRTGAIDALGQIGDRGALEPLINALGDPDWSVRKHSASALGGFGDASTVKPLIALLTDQNREVRQAAAGALVAIYQSQSLGAQERALILEQKGAIARPHEDRWEYTGRSSDCTSYHVDSGIGVEFPDI